MSASAKPGSVAQVDHLIDERGYKIPVGEDTSLKIASDMEPVVGGTSPTPWWRAGLIALFIVAALLLGLNMLLRQDPGYTTMMRGEGSEVVLFAARQRDDIRELLSFALSEDFFKLRQKAGVAIVA